MATNLFSKEERVAFEDILEGFEDAMTISKNVSIFGTDGVSMERSNDTIWRPVPYILNSEDRTIGSAVSGQDVKQLSVPSTLSFKKVVPWTLTALELRDMLQEGRLGQAAKQRLASDINTAVRDNVSLQGTIVSAISGAPGDYDDIATCESLMDEMGVQGDPRFMALTTRDYNGVSGNLASRQTINAKPTNALEKSFIGEFANFETFKLDAGLRLTAQTATPTIDTTGAQVRYVPLSSESTTAGEINVDNRYQVITISSTTGLAAGDCYTVAGIEAVHMIHKESTGQLKTFRIISVDTGTTMTVSPPMIGANSTPTAPETAYKNVEVVSTSATAAIVFLNDTATGANPFWFKDSIELMPGRYAVPEDEGVAVMRSTTSQGVEVVMSKKFDPSTFVSSIFLDTFFGVVNTNPEMNGILIWNQA